MTTCFHSTLLIIISQSWNCKLLHMLKSPYIVVSFTFTLICNNGMFVKMSGHKKVRSFTRLNICTKKIFVTSIKMLICVMWRFLMISFQLCVPQKDYSNILSKCTVVPFLCCLQFLYLSHLNRNRIRVSRLVS